MEWRRKDLRYLLGALGHRRLHAETMVRLRRLRCNEQGIRPFYGYSSELSEDDEPTTQVELPYWDDAAACWLEAPDVAACDVDVDQGPGSHDGDERDRNTQLTTQIPGGASEHAEAEQEATLEQCNELAAIGVALAKSAKLLPEVRTRDPRENEYMCALSPIMSSRVGACTEEDNKYLHLCMMKFFTRQHEKLQPRRLK